MEPNSGVVNAGRTILDRGLIATGQVKGAASSSSSSFSSDHSRRSSDSDSSLDDIFTASAAKTPTRTLSNGAFGKDDFQASSRTLKSCLSSSSSICRLGTNGRCHDRRANEEFDAPRNVSFSPFSDIQVREFEVTRAGDGCGHPSSSSSSGMTMAPRGASSDSLREKIERRRAQRASNGTQSCRASTAMGGFPCGSFIGNPGGTATVEPKGDASDPSRRVSPEISLHTTDGDGGGEPDGESSDSSCGAPSDSLREKIERRRAHRASNGMRARCSVATNPGGGYAAGDEVGGGPGDPTSQASSDSLRREGIDDVEKSPTPPPPRLSNSRRRAAASNAMGKSMCGDRRAGLDGTKGRLSLSFIDGKGLSKADIGDILWGMEGGKNECKKPLLEIGKG